MSEQFSPVLPPELPQDDQPQQPQPEVPLQHAEETPGEHVHDLVKIMHSNKPLAERIEELDPAAARAARRIAIIMGAERWRRSREQVRSKTQSIALKNSNSSNDVEPLWKQYPPEKPGKRRK